MGLMSHGPKSKSRTDMIAASFSTFRRIPSISPGPRLTQSDALEPSHRKNPDRLKTGRSEHVRSLQLQREARPIQIGHK